MFLFFQADIRKQGLESLELSSSTIAVARSAVNELTLACRHPFTVLVPLELLSCPPGFVTTNQCSFY